jgi:hypothetical protein
MKGMEVYFNVFFQHFLWSTKQNQGISQLKEPVSWLRIELEFYYGKKKRNIHNKGDCPTCENVT